MFKVRIKQKNLSFNYEKLSHLPIAIHADEKRLRQIIINLLDNAVKFTVKGRIVLKVGYYYDKIRLQVEDTGTGIASQDLGKIFQPFQQIDEQKNHIDGTGLGLSITKKLIEGMGGKLHVKSNIGRGSIFWTMLDLAEVPVFVKSAKAYKPRIVGFQGKTRKILIVDDDAVSRNFFGNFLINFGFEIIEAYDGKNCIEQAKQHKPDMILIDLEMPVMDGFEASKLIKHTPGLEHIIIILISASVFDYHIQQSLEAGCDDFMGKPINTDELLKLLEKHLQLTWIYAEDVPVEEDITTEMINEETTAALIGPSKQQTAVLLDLAMRGNIERILEQLNEYEKSDSKITPFADKIRELAKIFAEEEICETIEQYGKIYEY